MRVLAVTNALCVQALNEQLARKGQEINDYIEKHDIRVQRGDSEPAAPAPADPTKSNVLVASAWGSTPHYIITNK